MQYIIIARTTLSGLITRHNIDQANVDEELFNIWRRHPNQDTDYCIISQLIKHRYNEATCQICGTYVSKINQLPMVRVHDKFKDRQLYSLWMRSSGSSPTLVMLNATQKSIYEYVKDCAWPNFQYCIELQNDLHISLRPQSTPSEVLWKESDEFLKQFEGI